MFVVPPSERTVKIIVIITKLLTSVANDVVVARYLSVSWNEEYYKLMDICTDKLAAFDRCLVVPLGVVAMSLL